MATAQIQLYCEQIEAKISQMIDIVQAVDVDRLRKKPSPEAWSVMEVLCHVEEATVYWVEELRRVIQNRGGEWGRGLQDESRLAAVARADERTASNVMEGLHKAVQQARTILQSLQDEDLTLQAPHRNPKFGTKPLTFLLDHFIVEHLDKHIEQIRRNLAA